MVFGQLRLVEIGEQLFGLLILMLKLYVMKITIKEEFYEYV